MLGHAKLALPKRVTALLEVESGLNDPMSIFLVIFVIRVITEPATVTWQSGALLFVEEMIGGARWVSAVAGCSRNYSAACRLRSPPRWCWC